MRRTLPFALPYQTLCAVAAIAALGCSDPPGYEQTDPPPSEPEPATGGSDPGTATGGSDPGPTVPSLLGTGTMQGSGSSSNQYHTAHVSRSGVGYVLITNGWGPGFQSHSLSWSGTSFTVQSTQGNPGSSGQPASFPTVFCGKYSVNEVSDCGLPARIDSINTLRTGWRWAPNGNTGEYNAAYDIWLGDGTNLQSYLMVWLRDPPNFQPAGQRNGLYRGITVAGVPGTWDIWHGTVTVNGQTRPIVNWVRPEGEDLHEIEFDVMDLVRDAQTRGLDIPGTHVNSVAVGFEIWRGPISNLESLDFYVDVN